MSAIAERAGVGRESLYKALAPGESRYDTVLKVLHGLGVRLTVSPASPRASADWRLPTAAHLHRNQVRSPTFSAAKENFRQRGS